MDFGDGEFTFNVCGELVACHSFHFGCELSLYVRGQGEFSLQKLCASLLMWSGKVIAEGGQIWFTVSTV